MEKADKTNALMAIGDSWRVRLELRRNRRQSVDWHRHYKNTSGGHRLFLGWSARTLRFGLQLPQR